MREKQKRVFTMPLAELVIVVGIFAIVSVFLMRMYLAADTLQSNAVNISRATMLAQNAAEELKFELADGDFDAAAAKLGYETAGNVLSRTADEFTVTLTCEEQVNGAGVLYNMTVSVSVDEETLITLPTAVYAAQ